MILEGEREAILAWHGMCVHSSTLKPLLVLLSEQNLAGCGQSVARCLVRLLRGGAAGFVFGAFGLFS